MFQVGKKDERMITRGKNRMGVHFVIFNFKMGKHRNVFISLGEEAFGKEEK